MTTHEKYMRMCFELAKQGAGQVSPNPMVGAVLVFEDRVIGSGFHEHYGQAHAEVNCLASVHSRDQNLISQSVLYVSLEPCSHYGKTPPCADLILQNKIHKVVVGTKDYSTKVNGSGIQKLKDHGVDVVESVLEAEAFDLNKRFFTFHIKHRPFIILKWAQSNEGYLGLESKQIKLSNPNTDRLVHQWRAEEDAIWVGYRTVQIDNPTLNVRHVNGRNPIRIVYDRDDALRVEAHILDGTQSSIIFNHSKHHHDGLTEWIQVKEMNSLDEMLGLLHQRNVLSVIIEGGSKLLQQFIDANLWDEARSIHCATSLSEGIKAPVLKNFEPFKTIPSGSDEIYFYQNKNVSGFESFS